MGVKLFLDVEAAGAADNAFNAKIIAIGYVIDVSRRDKKYGIIAEWDVGGERVVLEEFLSLLEELESEYRYVDIIGYNIMRYDLPLIKQKIIEYGLMTPAEVNRYFDRFRVVDLLQLLLPHNRWRYKGLTLWRVMEIAGEEGIDVPQKFGSGEDVARWYSNGQYGEIIEHLKADLEAIVVLYWNFNRIADAVRSRA